MRSAWLLAAVVSVLAMASSATAAVFEPTRFNDPNPGPCKPNDCSLREAISAANERDGKDTVRLGEGRYVLTRPEVGIGDDNEDGDLDVTDETSFVGVSAKKSIVDGNGVDRVFAFLGFNKRAVSNLTITGGAAPSGGGSGGGFIVGPSELRLTGVVIDGNAATDGGGFYSVSPKLTITKTTIARNTASGVGGGIYIPQGFVGVPDISMQSSTVSANDATTGGGMLIGEAGSDDDPVGRIVNSTFARNKATGDAGGIAAIEGAVLELDNVSVGFNESDSDDTGSGDGGGIYSSTGATFQVEDSVLSTNVAGTTGFDQCEGGFLGGDNVVNAPAGCASFSGGTNIETATAIAMNLAANGGPTKTMALVSSGPAVGHVEFGCPGRDQRGERRPDTNCDAGAYEDQPE